MSDQPHYPYADGDHAVLGPDVIATADGMTICWKGAKYRRDHGEAAPVATQATVPATITDPEYLRQQYTAIISALYDNRPDHIAAELLRVHGRHLAQVRQRLRLADQVHRDDTATLDRVRALHREEYGSCSHCTRADSVLYPCPTIRALDQQQEQP